MHTSMLVQEIYIEKHQFTDVDKPDQMNVAIKLKSTAHGCSRKLNLKDGLDVKFVGK